MRAMELYGAIGAAFAIAFVTFGVTKIDSEARGSGVGFRLVIIPGVALFWPMLLARWVSGASGPPPEGNPHR